MNNDKILEKFEKSLERDKGKDIIKGNVYLSNKKYYESMFMEIFYDKLREFFSDYINNESSKENIRDNK